MQIKYISKQQQQQQQQQIEIDLKLKLNAKMLYPLSSVKYLPVKADEHLTWKPHMDGIPAKLNKANAMFLN